MSIKHRLARLEAATPRGNGPCFAIARYENETEDQARAAYPEIQFPGNADVICLRRSGSRPAVRPADDMPTHDPRGLFAVLAEIDGKTQSVRQHP